MTELEELKLAYAECSRQRNELLNKLKSQAQPEPVAWWIPKAEQFCLPSSDGTRPFAKAWEPLYTSPPAQRKPLTDEQIEEMANDFEEGYVFLYRSFARAIERAHGIKETT
jgi:hypothetical protein